MEESFLDVTLLFIFAFADHGADIFTKVKRVFDGQVTLLIVFLLWLLIVVTVGLGGNDHVWMGGRMNAV